MLHICCKALWVVLILTNGWLGSSGLLRGL
jgi:hypothetical protein